jgi:hypothetical protein
MDVNDLAGLGELANSKLANKSYKDALQPFAQQLGKMGEDVAKTFRLVFAPFQVAAAYQDRLQSWIERLRDKVPDERQVEPPPYIGGPVLSSLLFIEDSNPLQDLYLNLLARAIDKDRQDEAHPAFVHILSQMSPDEAVLMAVIRDNTLRFRVTEAVINECPGETFFKLAEPLDISTSFLRCPGRIQVSMHHLKQLGLIDLVYDDVGQRCVTPPTGFGLLFIQACIPEKMKVSLDPP